MLAGCCRGDGQVRVLVVGRGDDERLDIAARKQRLVAFLLAAAELGGERIDYEEFKDFDSLGEELRDFADAIASDRPPEVDGEAGMQVLAVVLAAIRSSELKRPVELKELLNTKG